MEELLGFVALLLELCEPGTGALTDGLIDEALPFELDGAWALRMRPLLSVCEFVDDEELVEEPGLAALLYGGLVLAAGLAGAGVPRIVVPRESLALDAPCVGFALPGVPRMVVFCGGGAAVCWLFGWVGGGVIMPGALFMAGGSVDGVREDEPGGTAELEDEDGCVPGELPPELPVVD